ncbi:MAG: FAD-dependent oxidoreductase [Ignavibacteria bacterium]|nr:FAD-dependent oxidoreductase [Ignavibacteria bacterium]
MQNKSIAIIGSGIAGISASIQLLKKNIPHTIFERRDFCGGRFYSFYDKNFEMELDNGQHFFVLSYKNFLEILNFLQTRKFVFFPKEEKIFFYRKDKEKAYFILSQKKRFFSLLFSSSFNFIEKLRYYQYYNLNKFFIELAIKSSDSFPKDIDAKEFLLSKKVPIPTIREFWEPLGVSIFNNSLEKIPANLFANVVKILFISGAGTNVIGYSCVQQSKILENYVKIIEETNSKIFFSHQITSISKTNGKFRVIANNEVEYFFDNIILCVQPNVLNKILPEDWLKDDYFKFLKHINFNPIVSIYIKTNKNIIEEDFGFLLNSPFHWIFNKSNMHELPTPPYFYSFTTSNATQLVSLSTKDILNLLQFEILEFFDKEINILKYKVIKDKFATIDINVKFNKYRPTQETPIEGLYIAGDWTQTMLPATLESAALSGKLAVQKMLEKMDIL